MSLIEVALFKSVQTLTRKAKSISISGQAVVINNQNKTALLSEYGALPYSLSQADSSAYKHDAQVDHIFVSDGPLSKPRIISLVFSDRVLTFSPVWLLATSAISWDQILATLNSLHIKGGVRKLVNGLNYLMFGD